jgi:hypothetical protein
MRPPLQGGLQLPDGNGMSEQGDQSSDKGRHASAIWDADASPGSEILQPCAVEGTNSPVLGVAVNAGAPTSQVPSATGLSLVHT